MLCKWWSYAVAAALAAVLGYSSGVQAQEAEAPRAYTGEELRQELPNNNHFVMFYAPWCGHCQKLEPTWEQLAELLNVEGSRVTIAKVDCTVEKEACSENDITGYPTLRFYKMGETEGVKFRGIRDLPGLSNFINEQLGDSESIDELAVPIKASPGVDLTEDTFFDHVSRGYHFVKFYAPWCGHCQKLAPTWDMLADSLSINNAVSISRIDCTLYRTVCTQFEVKGYPTLLWIQDGKKLEKYSGPRSHEDLKGFVSKMLAADKSKEDESEEDKSDSRAVMTLTTSSFEHGIQNGYVFVKFFAPWCGHCKRLAPTWEELGRKFIDHERVKIAKVDCSLPINKVICTTEHVDGFPSLYLFRNGRKISEYDGSRALDDLYEFVVEQMNNPHDEL